MSQGFLGLSDDDFWTSPASTFDAVVAQLYEENFQGISLDGPAVVRMDLRDSLPLAGVRIASTRDAHLINLKWCACMLVVRLETNEVFAAPAFTVKGERPAQPSEAMLKEFAWETEAQRFVTEVRRQCEDLPWLPGTYAITLVLLDIRSNSILTRLVRQEVKDEAVAAFLESRRTPSYPEPVWPPRAAKRGAPIEGHAAPDIPPHPGIRLAAERVVLASTGAQCIVRGSCKLEVLKREIVKKVPPEGEGAAINAGANVGDADATAVVPITLVLVAESERDPRLVRLRVPMYTPINPGESRPIVEGVFNVDLLSIPELFPTPFTGTTTYFAWALCGELISEPVCLALVGEDMLLPG
jgi:hypothetical protein